MNRQELFDTETMPSTSSILPRSLYRAAGVFLCLFLFISIAKPAVEDDTYAALEMEGNIIIWMGDGDYPFDYEGKGFTILKGREGQEYWEKAKRDWIARHPKVPRVKGDPGYDPVIHGEVEPPPDGLPELIEDLIARNPPESRS